MPNTREKLIELLKGAETKVAEMLSRPLELEEWLGVYAVYLIANGVTFAEDNNVPSKWIPVTDRLPALHTDDYKEPDGSRMQIELSDYQWVITASGYQTKARYETGVVFQGWLSEDDRTIRDVTHWMPLPEPPKGE